MHSKCDEISAGKDWKGIGQLTQAMMGYVDGKKYGVGLERRKISSWSDDISVRMGRTRSSPTSGYPCPSHRYTLVNAHRTSLRPHDVQLPSCFRDPRTPRFILLPATLVIYRESPVVRSFNGQCGIQLE